MPLKSYGVLIGRPIDKRLATRSNAHYQVHVIDATTDYRIAINVKSAEAPSEVEYIIIDQFSHPLLKDISPMERGFHTIPSKPGGIALDFIRANLFDRDKMRPLPYMVDGPNNDLNDALDVYIQRAIQDEDALVYAFGERWGPETKKKDDYFGFLPGNGIHDIHMNQGSVGQFADSNGVWQDGGLLIHYPQENQWVGIFLKFQSESWHTDDKTGNRINVPQPTPTPPDNPQHPGEPDKVVRIIAAMVNPVGGDPETETVTLLNASPNTVNLAGWQLADRMKDKMALNGTLKPGATVTVTLTKQVQLGNKGGQITLLDNKGLKVDGVAYVADDVKNEGWTLVF